MSDTNHPPIKCKPVGVGHYHFRNWSRDFRCPLCERVGRFSLNFLGKRTVVCDGKKFHKLELTIGGFKRAGLDINAFIKANPDIDPEANQ